MTNKPIGFYAGAVDFLNRTHKKIYNYEELVAWCEGYMWACRTYPLVDEIEGVAV